MQAGFAFLEAGSIRSKNTTNILIKNVLDVCKYNKNCFNFTLIFHLLFFLLSLSCPVPSCPVSSRPVLLCFVLSPLFNHNLESRGGLWWKRKGTKNYFIEILLMNLQSSTPSLWFQIWGLILAKDGLFCSKKMFMFADLIPLILNYHLQLLVRYLTGYSDTPSLSELKAMGLLVTSISHWQICQSTNTLTGFSNSFSRQLPQQLSVVPWQRELSSELTFCTLYF